MKKFFLVFSFLISFVYAESYYIFSQTSFGYGGDKLVINQNGERLMGTGDGLEVAFGALLKTFGTNEDFTTKVSAGIIYNWLSSIDGGTIHTFKVPLSLIQYYDFYRLRIGAGVTYHMFNRLNGNQNIRNIEFENAVGATFSLSYMMEKEPNYSLGIKFTKINYEEKETLNKLRGDRVSFYIESSF